MQIIVVGCGKVGRTLVSQLSKENNNVTVIDTDAQIIRDVSTMYDVMGVIGNGTSYNVLCEAGIEKADIVIAVTQSDEVNLLTCVMARRRTKCQTIARVRNPIYSAERHFIRDELGLSMTINPEYRAAKEMARLMQFPNAIEVDSFANDRIDLLRFKVPEDSMLVGISLKQATQKIGRDVLVCIAERGKEITIPNGDYIVENGDIITVILQPGQAKKFFNTIGVRMNKVKNAMIVCGGEISYYLIKMLLKMGIDVKVIDQNPKRCEELNDFFPGATVDCADGTDQTVLAEEHIENMDAFVACTGMDEVNAILALYAQERVKQKTIAKLNHVDFVDVIDKLQLDSVVNPKLLTTQKILQFVRATGNSMDSNVETLYRLMNGQVEALAFNIQTSSTITGIRLQDMKLKDSILIAGILRDDKLIIPGGQDQFLEGDTVIVITTHLGFGDIYDILKD
jgi:trk system potassium uptake protein TrkA